MTWRIEEIGDATAFRALKTQWDSLLRQSRQDSLFLSHTRLTTWWDVFGTHSDLRIVTCRDSSGELVGVLPTYITRIGRGVRARSRRLIGDFDAGSVGLTAFARPDAEADVYACLAEYLLAAPRDWDVLDLRLVEPDDAFVEAITSSVGSRVFAESGFTQRIRLPADWDSYKAMLSSGRRSSLNNALNKSRRAGDEFEIIENPSELTEAMRDFWALHEERMRAKFGPQFAVEEGYRRFVEQMSPKLLASGRLRLSFLCRAGRRVAVAYQTSYGDTIYGEKSGFMCDGGPADYLRPLLGHEIRNAIEGGFAVYDMMLGEDAYKRGWGVNEIHPLSQVLIYSGSLCGRLRRGRDVFAETVERRRAEHAKRQIVAAAG